MKLHGEAELPLPPERAFERLLDPRTIERCLPGCEGLHELGPGLYRTHLRAGAGPLHGSFEGRFQLSELRPSTSYRIAIEGRSTLGELSGGALVRLAPKGPGSALSYAGEVRVGGLFGALAAHALERAARHMLEHFFERLARELARELAPDGSSTRPEAP